MVMIASIAVGITERRLHVGRLISILLAVVHARISELMMAVMWRLTVLRHQMGRWPIAGDALMVIMRVRLRLRLLGWIIKAIWRTWRNWLLQNLMQIVRKLLFTWL